MTGKIAGLVLAGGRSVRFGQEKAVAPFQGSTLLERGLSVLQGSCFPLAINAAAGSGAAVLSVSLGLSCLDDPPQMPLGPLTGVLTGLRWAIAQHAAMLATVPCDTPALPFDLVAVLARALTDDADIAYAQAGSQDHYLCAVWRVGCADRIAAALADGAHPPVGRLFQSLRAAPVFFDDPNAFSNINTLEDLAKLQALPRYTGIL